VGGQKVESQGQTGEKEVTTPATPNDTVTISDEARQKYADSVTNKALDNFNASVTAGYDTRESRENQGALFDAYLNELRQQYGEEEAMARFTEFMKSQGYEIDDTVDDDMKPTKGSSTLGMKTNDRRFHNLMVLNPNLESIFGPILRLKDIGISGGTGMTTRGFYIPTEHSGSNFNIWSTAKETTKDGNTRYEAGTWAVYDSAYNADQSKVFDFWKNRNIEELSKEAGFDVGKYVDSVFESTPVWGKSFAAESVSTDLARIVNSILEEIGVRLEAGNNLALSLREDGKGGYDGMYVHMNFGDDALREKIQSAFDKAMGSGSANLNAFLNENAKVEAYDVGTLDGAFNNGVQSKQYFQQRRFLMSGDEPSAIVMGSGLDSQQKGYRFIKKVSNELDLTADTIWVKNSTDSRNLGEQAASMLRLIDEVRQNRDPV
jgi:hypothetical protein